jgi:hypothetical protein
MASKVKVTGNLKAEKDLASQETRWTPKLFNYILGPFPLLPTSRFMKGLTVTG